MFWHRIGPVASQLSWWFRETLTSGTLTVTLSPPTGGRVALTRLSLLSAGAANAGRLIQAETSVTAVMRASAAQPATTARLDPALIYPQDVAMTIRTIAGVGNSNGLSNGFIVRAYG